ncbi:MAG: HlyC/CorC family transporter [Opitutales bacterium]|nr:HlyC/CorC family transporter [Opitutales bacterium]
MSALVLVIVLTLGVSAFCSLLEAFILSTTSAEIESLKQRHAQVGARLQRFKDRIEQSTTSILTLNTVANTAGMSLVGAVTVAVFPGRPDILGWVTVGMVVGILILSEILPKNIGVAYRKVLQVYLVYPLWIVCIAMAPFAWIASRMLRNVVRNQMPSHEEQEEEIRLLAERSAQAGALTGSERDLITNALSLDDVNVAEIMTPRTVTTFLSKDQTVGEVCKDFRQMPFSRIPVYADGFDEIVGIVKRRDLLQAYGQDKDHLKIGEVMKKAVFVPETASALDALQLLLRTHKKLAVVVDEYGSTAGVVTLEDIFEELIGEEIYDETDLAVDMRELAKKRAKHRPAPTPDASDDAAPAETPADTANPVSPARGERG